MKKIMAIMIISLSMILSSCDLIAKYNITVVNNCSNSGTNFKILVYVDKSSSAPSAYITLNYGSSQEFSELEYGTYYLHIKAPNDTGVPALAQNHVAKQITVNRNDTWKVTWSSSNGYEVTY